LKRLHPAILSLASGVLFWLSWPTSPLTPLVFFGFVPLLLLGDLGLKRNSFFKYTYLALFAWNLLTTWWIVNASLVGAMMAIILNSLIMCLPLLGYRSFKNKFGRTTGYFSLICFWMAFEYIHLNWQLSWPWLSLGNVFASQPDWVQWYEYTGSGGGTLWVLVVNVLVYELGQIQNPKFEIQKWITKRGIVAVLCLLLPIIVSYVIGSMSGLDNLMVMKRRMKDNVVIIQPNIDPYSKFEQGSAAQQIQTHLRLTMASIDTNTRLVIWPETALPANIPIDETRSHPVYQPVIDFINSHPNLVLLTGIETMRWYGTTKPASPYARKHPSGDYYDSYNAAVSIKAGQPLQFYVKSKLVPGVETLPTFLNVLGPVFEKFGGTTGGYAMDTASVAFAHQGNYFVTAPIICYESVFGEYVASYVQKGANLLTIITNDGWWGNTPGHKQHLAYARLRAIETRRWVARSANTGISAVIDNYGQLVESRGWDKAEVIKYMIPAFTRQTFYVRNGDYLYRFFALLAGLLVLWNLITVVQKRARKTR
jgi:apolipoprotein N-acyltransferase